MPWKEVTVVSLRKEFVTLAMTDDSNISRLCSRFGISRKTGYKWINRFFEEGERGLDNQSKRPDESPRKTSNEMEKAIVAVRMEHLRWGGRKIGKRLKDLGCRGIPTPSTITSILQRHRLIRPEESEKHKAFERFERAEPNELWQMDFKGYVPCPEGQCHPFTVLDDHSRYAIALKACLNERGETVKNCLIETFRRYGLPLQILADNGVPWGADCEHGYTSLTVWLIRLGVVVSHSRPYHPQTLGKDERFHRTLKAELLGTYVPWKMPECQHRFDDWRMVYNCQRPHEALNMEAPAKHYHVSNRPFPAKLEDIEYNSDDIVRKVQQGGFIFFKGREYRMPKAFYRQHVALRPRPEEDGIMDIFFCQQEIATINLKHHD